MTGADIVAEAMTGPNALETPLLIDLIDKALAAERERCAKMIEQNCCLCDSCRKSLAEKVREVINPNSPGPTVYACEASEEVKELELLRAKLAEAERQRDEAAEELATLRGLDPAEDCPKCASAEKRAEEAEKRTVSRKDWELVRKERDHWATIAEEMQAAGRATDKKLTEVENKASRLVEAIKPMFFNAMYAMRAMSTWADDDPRWEIDEDEADKDMDASEQNWLKLEEILKDFGVIWEGQKECCEHEWAVARNEHVVSGEICLKCSAVRAGNAAKE